MVATSLLQAISIRKTFKLHSRPLGRFVEFTTRHGACAMRGQRRRKSTFLNVIMGLIAPDGGELLSTASRTNSWAPPKRSTPASR